jgi:hypothetical protein
MNPAIIQALLMLIEEAVKLAPDVVKDIEGLIHPTPAGVPVPPIEPQVASDTQPGVDALK